MDDKDRELIKARLILGTDLNPRVVPLFLTKELVNDAVALGKFMQRILLEEDDG